MGGKLDINNTLFKDRGRKNDLNLAIENGVYNAGEETLNRPANASNYGTILVCGSGNFISQIYIPNYDNMGKYGLYSRVSVDIGSNWGKWNYIGS